MFDINFYKLSILLKKIIFETVVMMLTTMKTLRSFSFIHGTRQATIQATGKPDAVACNCNPAKKEAKWLNDEW